MISVIIPVYNEATTIRDVLRRVASVPIPIDEYVGGEVLFSQEQHHNCNEVRPAAAVAIECNSQ